VNARTLAAPILLEASTMRAVPLLLPAASRRRFLQPGFLNRFREGTEMNTLRRLLIASLAAIALAPAGAWAADVTGDWIMSVETQAGTGSPSFSLEQEGEAVSGTYKGQLGEAPVTGTVKGNDIVLSFKVNAQGTELVMTYTGTVDGSTMKGKVALGDLGEGTFTGKKS
jgi:hypothetical protein